jgi:hypothetical protein
MLPTNYLLVVDTFNQRKLKEHETMIPNKLFLYTLYIVN